jgi:DNA-binding XRE family transcriptional regulator
MKTRPNQSIRELRQTLGQTQGAFAAMLGASKDTVVSWELGRNKLSPQFARRIMFATGAEPETLLRGRGGVTTCGHPATRQPFTAEAFAQHRKSNWGRSDEAAVRHHLKHCVDALRILFLAVARPTGDSNRLQLPAVLESFSQWCEQTRVDFQLEKSIEAQLEERKFRLGRTHTYGFWRKLNKDNPLAAEAAGFKDDRSKRDEDEVFVGCEAVPEWTPGASMRGPTPGRTRILRKK